MKEAKIQISKDVDFDWTLEQKFWNVGKPLERLTEEISRKNKLPTRFWNPAIVKLTL